MNEARWLFLGWIWPLLNQAVFLEAAWVVLKIGSSLKLNQWYLSKKLHVIFWLTSSLPMCHLVTLSWPPPPSPTVSVIIWMAPYQQIGAKDQCKNIINWVWQLVQFMHRYGWWNRICAHKRPFKNTWRAKCQKELAFCVYARVTKKHMGGLKMTRIIWNLNFLIVKATTSLPS